MIFQLCSLTLINNCIIYIYIYSIKEYYLTKFYSSQFDLWQTSEANKTLNKGRIILSQTKLGKLTKYHNLKLTI